MTRLLNVIARIWHRLFGTHFYTHDATVPSAEGSLRRQRCVRCGAISYELIPMRGKR